MTNIAFVALALTLAADPLPVKSTGTSDSATVDAKSQEETTPPADPTPPPTVAGKPAESDIEVLEEIIDLEQAEDPAAGWYGQGFPGAVRVLALPTARTLRRGGWEFVIDHRSATPIYNSSSDRPFTATWNGLLGLDGPMQTGLGLRYGVLDNLDVGIGRAGSMRTDTFEFDARFQILRQVNMPLDLALRAGVTWFSQPGVEDAHGFFGQLLASRLVANRLLLVAGVLYHSNSTNDTKYNQDKQWSVAGAAGVEVRLIAPLALDAELVSCTAGYCSKNPAFSAGVKYITTRHTFALLCGNTQYLTADGYITNTDRPWGDLAIGFNITREY